MRSLPILFMLILAGCATSDLQNGRELIGRFDGDDGSYFVLTDDRKVTYHGIPAVWRDTKAPADETISGFGTWRLAGDTLIVSVRDDDARAAQVTRKIDTFDLQRGRWGLILSIDTGHGSSYALCYVQPYRP